VITRVAEIGSGNVCMLDLQKRKKAPTAAGEGLPKFSNNCCPDTLAQTDAKLGMALLGVKRLRRSGTTGERLPLL
jgi:hypothetical protein